MVSTLLFANKFPIELSKKTILIIQSIIFTIDDLIDSLMVWLMMSIKAKNMELMAIETISKRINAELSCALPPQTMFGGTTPIITII